MIVVNEFILCLDSITIETPNDKLDVIDGKIEVPNTPGLGVTIKEELIIRE